MRLLLDTHVWTSGLIAPKRLGAAVRRALESPRNELFLSSVSPWEVITLHRRGKVRLPHDPLQWIDQAIARSPVTDLPLSREVAMETGRFEMHHFDPFDYLIVATARVHDLVLVTGDALIIESNAVEVLVP